MKSFRLALRVFYSKICRFSFVHPIWFCIFLAPILTLIVESISRHSLFAGIGYMIFHPFFFLFNSLIIYFLFALALFLPKRNFFILLLSVFWLVLGTTNGILLAMRVTPFTPIDIRIFITGFDGIASAYLSVVQMILIILLLLALLVLLIILGIRSQKSGKAPMRKFFWSLLLTVVLLAGFFFGTELTHHTPKRYENLTDSYDHYGYVYCLTYCLFDRGIEEPENYSEKTVEQSLDELKETPTVVPDETPNVIFVQLESFFDLEYVKKLTLSEDPIPTFTALKEQYTSGFLKVPWVGSGTANTEFEILTGMNLDYFGSGEYPYETILRTTACETIGFNLKELGYSTHAIHNHTANFYGRNNIYPHLGFDTFQPIEYMDSPEYNSVGWAKDVILTQEILTAVESTKTRDFVFAVSVQGHGQYPTDFIPDENGIAVSGLGAALNSQIAFYASQIHEMDQFIQNLINTFADYSEKTVIVFYGDHLPSISLEANQLSNKNLLQTEYVIWANYDLPENDRDLSSHQLSSYVCEQIGINNGLVNKLHQNYRTSRNYSELLNLLQYDMLYGNRYLYPTGYPYQPTEMQMGTLPLSVTGIEYAEHEGYRISGYGFTETTVLLVNDEEVDRILVSYDTLQLAEFSLQEGDRIRIQQYTQDGTILLGETEEFLYTTKK